MEGPSSVEYVGQGALQRAMRIACQDMGWQASEQLPPAPHVTGKSLPAACRAVNQSLEAPAFRRGCHVRSDLAEPIARGTTGPPYRSNAAALGPASPGHGPLPRA